MTQIKLSSINPVRTISFFPIPLKEKFFRILKILSDGKNWLCQSVLTIQMAQEYRYFRLPFGAVSITPLRLLDAILLALFEVACELSILEQPLINVD